MRMLTRGCDGFKRKRRSRDGMGQGCEGMGMTFEIGDRDDMLCMP